MTLQLGYIGLTIAICVWLIVIGFNTIDKSFAPDRAKKKKLLLVASLIIWQLYIYLVSVSGFIKTLEFPPRFVLMMILPSFVFTGIFIYQNRKNDWILNIIPSRLFFFQSFRILVETLFAASVAAGILHKEASIHGYNYDMIYAFTIPAIGVLIFVLNYLNLKVARAWNYLGLLVIASIIFVFQTTVYAPHLYGASEPLMPLEALTYPYVLIAGFLMPVAVFIHVLSIVQLNRIIKMNQ
ncbi:hypothetical protein [Ekhidna sp.]|uniref:hypothetical protein n=1 Tax=Ekhidna sp. TaxID=2608089 RepID=UPI0032967F26